MVNFFKHEIEPEIIRFKYTLLGNLYSKHSYNNTSHDFDQYTLMSFIILVFFK